MYLLLTPDKLHIRVEQLLHYSINAVRMGVRTVCLDLNEAFDRLYAYKYTGSNPGVVTSCCCAWLKSSSADLASCQGGEVGFAAGVSQCSRWGDTGVVG